MDSSDSSAAFLDGHTPPAPHAAAALAVDDDIAETVAFIKRRDAREALPGRELRDALKSLQPLLTDPGALHFLFEPEALAQWRVVRDQDPHTFAVYISEYRRRSTYELTQLLSKQIGPPAQDPADSGAGTPLPGYTASAIWEGCEPPRYLTKRILSPGELTVLFGQSGHLKSVTAVDLALCNATGTPFHGIRTRKVGMLYVAGEGHAGIKKRVKAWMLKHGRDSSSEQPALFITSEGLDLVGNPERR